MDTQAEIAVYFDRLAAKGAADVDFSDELFAALCMDFNHALKLAEGNLRVSISKRLYGLLLHHHVHVLAKTLPAVNAFLLSPRLIETSPGVFCATYNFSKEWAMISNNTRRRIPVMPIINGI